MSKPIFVPIALSLAEAEAAFNACRTVFASLTAMGAATSGLGVDLGRAMYVVAQATDKARRQAGRDPCRSNTLDREFGGGAEE
jgi:hypothetical protein